MKEIHHSIHWINFQSSKDYAVRYVYRAYTLGNRPIGSGGVIKVPGHEIDNWEVGELVDGHMDFRSNLYGLCLLTGIKHD